MKAVEVTGTLDETGQLSLDRPIENFAPSRVRIIVLFPDKYILQEQEKYRDRLVRRNPKPAIVPSKSKQISENLAKEVV